MTLCPSNMLDSNVSLTGTVISSSTVDVQKIVIIRGIWGRIPIISFLKKSDFRTKIIEFVSILHGDLAPPAPVRY